MEPAPGVLATSTLSAIEDIEPKFNVPKSVTESLLLVPRAHPLVITEETVKLLVVISADAATENRANKAAKVKWQVISLIFTCLPG
ncbi:hypothetical protein GCM10009414_22650 [Tatumella terrea]